MTVALVLSSFGLVFVVTAQWPSGVAAFNRGGCALSFSDAAPSSNVAILSLTMAAYAGGILLLVRWSPLRSAFGCLAGRGRARSWCF